MRNLFEPPTSIEEAVQRRQQLAQDVKAIESQKARARQNPGGFTADWHIKAATAMRHKAIEIKRLDEWVVGKADDDRRCITALVAVLHRNRHLLSTEDRAVLDAVLRGETPDALDQMITIALEDL